MKRVGVKKISYIIFLISAFLCLASSCFINNDRADASVNTSVKITQEVSLGESVVPKGIITDENHLLFGIGDNLFQAICAIRNTLLGYVNLTSFSTHFFFEEIDSIDTSGLPDSTRNQAIKIKTDIQNGILNLSTGKDAEYVCLKNISPIESIDGLKNLDLSKIIKLYLNNNAISSLRAETFATLGNLTHLSLVGNKLANFKLYSPHLVDIDLHSNQLTNVDLRGLQDNAIVDLSFNKIKSVEDIKTNNNLSFLNLAFNLLTNTTQIENFKELLNPACKLVLLVQNSDKVLNYQDKITIYQDSLVNNFSALFKYYEGNELDENSLPVSSFTGDICSVNPTAKNSKFELLSIPAGRIELKFSFSNPLDVLINNDLKVILEQGIPYQIALNKPDIEVLVGNKIVKDFVQKDNMNLNIKYNISEDNLQYDNIYNNLTYKFTSGDNIYRQSNFKIEKNGEYNLTAYVQFDGIDSKGASIRLIKNNPFALNLTMFLVVFIFIVITVIVFLVKWIREGGEIAPLNDREAHRINRRNRTNNNLDNKNNTINEDDEVDL